MPWASGVLSCLHIPPNWGRRTPDICYRHIRPCCLFHSRLMGRGKEVRVTTPVFSRKLLCLPWTRAFQFSFLRIWSLATSLLICSKYVMCSYLLRLRHSSSSFMQNIGWQFISSWHDPWQQSSCRTSPCPSPPDFFSVSCRVILGSSNVPLAIFRSPFYGQSS